MENPNPPEISEGLLLLASAHQWRGPFHKCVVLVAQQEEEGVFGLTLNNPLDHKVSEYLDPEEFADVSDIDVFWGGPVKTDSIFFSAFWPAKDKGKHWNYQTRISREDAVEMRAKGYIVRAFIGYTYWENSQLEWELKSTNFWMPLSHPLSCVSDYDGPEMWEALARKHSPYGAMIAQMPDFPELN